MVPAVTRDGLVRFAVVGMDHPHIYDQVRHALRGGARLVGFYDPDEGRSTKFVDAFGDVARARTEDELLDRNDVDLILTSTIPSERAPLGVRAMRHGKDFMTDKPGFTTLTQLAEVRAVQAETGRIYSVCF